MKIAVLGGTGRAGSEIVGELARRGHAITAIARKPTAATEPGITPLAVDATDAAALTAAIKGHDAVVSAMHFANPGIAEVVAAARAAGVRRLLVVGGAGSLEVAPGQPLIHQPDFPPEYLGEARAGADALDYLRGIDDLDWTFLSPSAFFFEGPRTGTFRLGKDALLSNADGSSISFADYAIAMADEIEHPAHIRARFTVGY